MGKSSRGDIYRKSGEAGPGSYNPSSGFGGPKAFISGRYGQHSGDQVPGPGQYNPDTKLRQSRTTYQYTMQGRPNTSTRDNGPGPGSYELDKGKGKGGIKFGKDTRSGLNHSSAEKTNYRRHRMEASFAVSRTWQLGELRGQRRYTTEPLIGQDLRGVP